MRTTDPDPTPFRPLGEKVTKPAPAPASSSPSPRGPSGIVYDKNGRASTTNHKPYAALTLEDAIANWREHYACEVQLDFLP